MDLDLHPATCYPVSTGTVVLYLVGHLIDGVDWAVDEHAADDLRPERVPDGGVDAQVEELEPAPLGGDPQHLSDAADLERAADDDRENGGEHEDWLFGFGLMSWDEIIFISSWKSALFRPNKWSKVAWSKPSLTQPLTTFIWRAQYMYIIKSRLKKTSLKSLIH